MLYIVLIEYKQRQSSALDDKSYHLWQI